MQGEGCRSGSSVRVAVRTCDGQRRLYRFADALHHDDARQIVKEQVLVAKTILVEVAKRPVARIYPDQVAA